MIEMKGRERRQRKSIHTNSCTRITTEIYIAAFKNAVSGGLPAIFGPIQQSCAAGQPMLSIVGEDRGDNGEGYAQEEVHV